MLKIVVTETGAGGVNVKLEGRIGGPWVETLRDSCVPLLASGRAVTLDLADVSYVGPAGIVLVHDLATRGVEVINGSPFVAEQLHGGAAMLATDTLTSLVLPLVPATPGIAAVPLPPGQDGRARRLLSRARRGDVESLGALVREHGPRMLAAAWHLLQGPGEAREAVHEAWLQALRGDDERRSAGPLGTWLEELATHSAMMRLRAASEGPDQEIDAPLPRFDDTGHWIGEPPRRSDEEGPEEAEERLAEAVGRLPLQYRGLVILREIVGLSPRETAHALGIDGPTAARRLHRALEALCALVHEGAVRRGQRLRQASVPQ